MIRGHFVPKAWQQGERDFRWRGGDVSRMEALPTGSLLWPSPC